MLGGHCQRQCWPRQRPGERAGGAGEVAGHVDQVDAQGREPCAGLETRGGLPAARVRLSAMLAITGREVFALDFPVGARADGPSTRRCPARWSRGRGAQPQRPGWAACTGLGVPAGQHLLASLQHS